MDAKMKETILQNVKRGLTFIAKIIGIILVGTGINFLAFFLKDYVTYIQEIKDIIYKFSFFHFMQLSFVGIVVFLLCLQWKLIWKGKQTQENKKIAVLASKAYFYIFFTVLAMKIHTFFLIYYMNIEELKIHFFNILVSELFIYIIYFYIVLLVKLIKEMFSGFKIECIRFIRMIKKG